MKSNILGLTCALGIVSLTMPAIAVTNNKYQIRGDYAYASFYQYDDCTYTYVDVSAYDNVIKSGPGAPTAQKEAYLNYSKFNYCTGEGSYSYGSVTNPDFKIQGGLKSASLNTTITLYDYNTGTSKTAQVNLTWTSTGTTYRGNSHFQSKGPGYMFISRSKGSWTDAIVSGSVSVDGMDVIGGSSSYGTIGNSNSGSIEIIKK